MNRLTPVDLIPGVSTVVCIFQTKLDDLTFPGSDAGKPVLRSSPQSVGPGLRAQQTWVLSSPLVGGASSRTADKQGRSWVHRKTVELLGPQLDHCWQAGHLSPACLLEEALLSLGLHLCFTTYYLGSKVLPKVLLVMDVCQVIFFCERMKAKELLFYYLTDMTSHI